MHVGNRIFCLEGVDGKKSGVYLLQQVFLLLQFFLRESFSFIYLSLFFFLDLG